MIINSDKRTSFPLTETQFLFISVILIDIVLLYVVVWYDYEEDTREIDWYARWVRKKTKMIAPATYLKGVFTQTDYVSIFSQIAIQMAVYLVWRTIAKKIFYKFYS